MTNFIEDKNQIHSNKWLVFMLFLLLCFAERDRKMEQLLNNGGVGFTCPRGFAPKWIWNHHMLKLCYTVKDLYAFYVDFSCY